MLTDSSGGPIFNLDGEVVAINNIKANADGISFGIRIDSVLSLISQLITTGQVMRPWIGIQMCPINPEVNIQIDER